MFILPALNKTKYFDNVPIITVTCPHEAMQIINIDVIDPIEPTSRGCEYKCYVW